MRRVFVIVMLVVCCISGCAAVRDLFLPGSNASDQNRRFWDQTSDNPYR
ncbi:hypothetical protein LF1_52970 [Rubripirellula obstinata]|uniref:Lipoprotein n=1 Tax=Rubripirellula obstinata TaxID=406547 RepID=A0A5B1CBG9_9BACT|nr:membrane or secreted protein [Rubripirellula obstinata]KAA1257175.1 hypothetical protein LF1_55750 [Rubripirellula obstinata]KAA1257335.1 hypothetical protein LF1_54840 [Rubripirellula obstinata]KAA1257448.1 hypothetical protein LF1_52970 [Rubripirellula obstinata]